MILTEKQISEFFDYVEKRHTVFRNRHILDLTRDSWYSHLRGKSKDTLMKVSLANVYREFDRGTLYVLKNIVEKSKNLPDLILNCTIYRLFNLESTFDQIGFQSWNIAWDPDPIYHRLVGQNGLFTGSFVVHSFASYDKICEMRGYHDSKMARILLMIQREIIPLIPEIAACIRGKSDAKYLHEKFVRVYGIGDFLAYEILTDIFYSDLADGYNEDSYVNVGPGASAGIYELTGIEGDDEVCCAIIQELSDLSWTRLDSRYPRHLTLRNVEHTLCEYYKFVKHVRTNNMKKAYSVDRGPVDLSPAYSLHQRKPGKLVGEN